MGRTVDNVIKILTLAGLLLGLTSASVSLQQGVNLDIDMEVQSIEMVDDEALFIVVDVAIRYLGLFPRWVSWSAPISIRKVGESDPVQFDFIDYGETVEVVDRLWLRPLRTENLSVLTPVERRGMYYVVLDLDVGRGKERRTIQKIVQVPPKDDD